jgi:hypothetical protein
MAVTAGTRLGAYEVLGQDLDRDVAFQPRIARAIDLAHAVIRKYYIRPLI